MAEFKGHLVFRPEMPSGFGPASLEEHIRSCVRGAILTRRGERGLRPELGSDIASFLFRPLDASLRLEIEGALRQAIERSEPRVAVDTVAVATDEVDATRIKIRLKYRIRESNKVDKMEVAL